MGLLDGKRALITGGSRGLGRAMALAFAREGARVAFTFERREAAATETQEALSAFGESRAFKCSVLDRATTRWVLKTVVEAWGGLDILVNNAAINQTLPFALIDEEDWDEVMDVNVKGTYLTTHEVLRQMIRQKSGHILNVGSLAGQRMLDAPVHYSTSKAAIAGFTKALAKEVSRHQIRVNCLAPGLLEEGVGENIPPHHLEDYLHHCSLGRVGTLEEVARFAAFLVSDANGYMNGEVVVMDGGL